MNFKFKGKEKLSKEEKKKIKEEKYYSKLKNTIREKSSKSKYTEKKMMNNRIGNAQSFVNVKEVREDGTIILKDNKVASIIEVGAIDLSLTSDSERNQFFHFMKKLYQLRNLTIKCYKIDKKINLNLNKEYLAQMKEIVKTDPKKQLLLTDQELVINDLEKENLTLASNYYWVLIAKNDFELNKQREDLMNLANNVILNLPMELITNRLEIFQILSKIYMTNNSLEELIWSDLPDLMAPINLHERSDSIILDDKTIQMVSIKTTPKFTEDLFLDGMFNIPNVNVCLTIKEVMDQQQLVNWIDRQYQFLLADMYSTKKLGEATELTQEQEQYQQLMQEIKMGDEVIRECTITFVLSGTKEEREASLNLLKTSADFYHIKLDIPMFRQMEAWQSFDLRDQSFKDYAFYCPTQTIANGFPFTRTFFIDNSGYILGTDVFTDLPFIFNPYVLTSQRTGHNISIVGTTGSGKSFLGKKTILDLFARNTKIMILDAENEYKDLVESNGGEYIDLYSKKGGIINPLQIRYTSTNEDNDDVEASINDCPLAKHLSFLETFFSCAFEEIKEKELVMLLKVCEDLYATKGITNKTTISQLKELQPTNYPIFTELYNYLVTISDSLPHSDEEKEILSQLKILLSRFTIGTDSFLFNGYTNIDLSNDLIAFNLQELLFSENKRLINTQILNLLTYLNNAIVQNKIDTENLKEEDRKRIFIFIDEFHLFIDEDNPVILKNIGQIARRIRKYNGSVCVATQSIKDFVGNANILRHSTAIFNNCQYQFVGILKEADLLAYLELFKQNPLTETQKQFLLQAQQGQFLISIDSKRRFRVQVIATELEREMMGV